MAKRIRIIPWLDESKLNKQLKNIGKWQEKIKVDIDIENDGIDGANQKMRQLSDVAKDNNTIFGKLKNTISKTFSDRVSMTGYLFTLNEINKAGQNAKKTMEELDKAITDLSIATNMPREATNGLLTDYNKMAKDLSSTTVQVSSAADDYIRAGKSIKEAESLIQSSIMLSKLGQIDADEATKDLLSTMNAYDMSIEEVSRALDAMVAIDMKASTSAGEIAQALKYCASNADLAGLSFNNLISIISSIQHKTGQAAEVVGNTMNTVLSRYKNVKLGNLTDDSGEDISNVETSLKELGIQLRNSAQDFRDFDEVYQEVAQNWNNYTEVQQASISKELGGVRQMNRVIAMFEGYNKVLELTEVAANSAGTALDKFQTSYVNSLEAEENKLQASFETMIIDSNIDEVYSDILDATTALLDFINETNALKGAVTALTVTGGVKAFLSIRTGITEAYIALNKFANALDVVKNPTISTDDFNRLLLLTKGLSENQLKLIVSSQSLGLEQKKLILTNAGLSSEEAKLQLQTWGITTAQTGLKASTINLKNVFRSLWATLMANPLIAVTAVISGATMAWQTYKSKLEEVRQTTEDAANTFKDSSKSLEDYIERYKDLRQALIEAKGDEEATYEVKQQLLELQKELNEVYGEEYGKINLVTDAYKDQTAELQRYNKELANTYLNENREGIKQAKKKMTSKESYRLSPMNISSKGEYGQSIKEVAEKYKDDGVYLAEDTFGNFTVYINADAQNAYETINAFEGDLREKADELGREDIFDDLLDISSKSLNKAKEVVDNFGESYKQALIAEIQVDDSKLSTYKEMQSAVEAYNNAVANSENPYDDTSVTTARNNLKNLQTSIEENETEWGMYKIIVDEVFDQADTRVYDFNQKIKSDKSLKALVKELEGLDDVEIGALADISDDGDAFDQLAEAADEYGVSVEELIELLLELEVVQSAVNETMEETQPPSFTEVLSNIQSLSTGLGQLDKIYADIKDKGEFDFSSIFNNEDFTNTFGNLGQEYEDFLKVISSSPTDINACQEAFNNLATAYIESTGALDNLTKETETQAIAMLEQMGVSNALAIVESQLAAQEIYLKFKTNEATVSIYEQIKGLLAEGEASNVAYSALFELCEQEEIFKNTDLGVTDKVLELEQLALAFGLTADSIRSAESYIQGAHAAARYGDAQGRTGQEAYDAAMEEAYQLMKDDYQKQIEEKFADIRAKYTGGTTTKNLSSSSTSTAKETKQAFDWTANSITNLQNKLDNLNTKLENTTGWQKQLAIQKEIIDAQKDLMDGYVSQANAYKSYYKEVSKGLTKQQKAEIESGKVFKVQDYGQETYDKLTKAQSAYQDWQEALKNVNNTLLDISETADIIYNIPLEKATEKVEDFTEKIEKLEQGLSNINKVEDIQSIYNKQRKSYTKIYMEHLQAEADAKTNLSTVSRQLASSIDGENKKKQESIKKSIEKGKAIDTSSLKTEKAKKAATEYNSALEASKTATKNTKKALEEYTASLQELANKQVQQIIGFYDNRSAINSAKQDRFQSQMDIMEEQGQTPGVAFYKKKISLSESESERLEKEKSKLIAQIEKGNLTSDEYYEALQHLYEIDDEIDKCTLNQIEWNNAIRQLEWDKFDQLRDEISDINKEATFMSSLLNEDNFIDDNGNLTDEGLTAQALHAQSYNAYMADSEKLGEEIKKINADLAKDPNNQTLLTRRNELIEAQRESILNAHEEKEAIHDLVEKAYEAQIEAMTELADKKQELLDKEKALHDYQKSIREQQTDITVLRKQIAALSNSTDREDIAKRLKLEEQLREAEEKLAEDQYQHSIDTQKDALDEALETYKEKTEDYLKDEEQVFEDTLNSINNHATNVLEALKNKAESVGYELSESIITIWSNTTPIDNYENAVIDSFTGIGTAIDNVTSKLYEMYEAYEKLSEISVSDTKSEYTQYPTQEEGTNSTAVNDPTKIKEILGKASGKSGVSNAGDSNLNKYIASLGYGMLSREQMVELAQALGLSNITDVDSLKANGTTSIKEALENYLNSGSAVVDGLTKTGGISAANKENIISLIRSAEEYPRDRKNLSDLNKYIYDTYDKKWLTQSQMVTLAQYLGYSDINTEDDVTSALKSKMLTKLKKAGFHDGGIIKKATGEDGIILANSGEAVLTKDEVVLFRSTADQVKYLSEHITPINTMVENMQLWRMNTLPKIESVNRNVGGATVNVVVNGNMDNVTVERLKSEISSAMQITKAETLKATPDYMWSEMRKFGC